MAVRNAQDSVNMINTAEAALDSMVSSLQRIRELAIQAGNTGTNDIQAIQAIQDEAYSSRLTKPTGSPPPPFSSAFSSLAITPTNPRPCGPGSNRGSISNDPNASNLRSGTSILNIRRTIAGMKIFSPYESRWPSPLRDRDQGRDRYRGDNGTVFGHYRHGRGYYSALSELTFNGVSLNANNMIAFQGVLSDGITPLPAPSVSAPFF